MKQLPIVAEYLRFLMKEKKYWMIPIMLLLLLIGTLVILLEGSAVAPFIYAIF